MTELQLLSQNVTDSARREMAVKAKQGVPALRMGAVAGTLGVMAAAASYRLSVLLLEKVMPSETAALTATVVYGGDGSSTPSPTESRDVLPKRQVADAG
jgi:hypothetical protein